MKFQTARGVRDLAPEEKILKNQVVKTIQNAFERYGFMPLETPIIERYDTLVAKGAAGEESDVMKEVFKLTDQGKRNLGLRFDLTVPLARYVAMNPTLKLPFKRYQVGRVYRDGPIKAGRTREFWQFDGDVVGTKSMIAEAELLALADAVFTELGLSVVIKINNRKILNGILEKAGISEKDNAIIAIDKMEKIGSKGVKSEMKERGYTGSQIKKVFEVLKEEVSLKDLDKSLPNNEGITEMKELLGYLKKLGVKSVKYEASLARGLAYYTGTVYEVFLKKGAVTSSIGSGGRYDDMVGNFMGGGRVVPAVGFSFGLVPILESLKGDVKTSTQVLVIPINTVDESLLVAQELRSLGINVDFAMGKKGVSKNLQYANALSIPYSVIIGEKELAQKKVMLRDMTTGEEKLVSVKSVVKHVN